METPCTRRASCSKVRRSSACGTLTASSNPTHQIVAESAYLDASRLAPEDARPQSNLAAVYFELGRYPDCTDACRKALDLLGKDSQGGLVDRTRVRLARSLVFSGKLQEARDALSEVESEQSRKALEPSLARTLNLPASHDEIQADRKRLIDDVAYYRAPL